MVKTLVYSRNGFDDDPKMLRAQLDKLSPDTKGKNLSNSGTLWNFYSSMRKGDIVFLKLGRILALGEVKSNYMFDETRDVLKHVREVDWIRQGSWDRRKEFGPTTLSRYPKENTAKDQDQRVTYRKHWAWCEEMVQRILG